MHESTRLQLSQRNERNARMRAIEQARLVGARALLHDFCFGRLLDHDYWLDDERAPDFARTVDIHRKPGYDPVELFVDPAIRLPMLAIASKVVKRKLGFRSLLDVISLKDTQLVKGSHGRPTDDTEDGPLLISTRAELLPEGEVAATDFKRLILDHVFEAA